MRDAKAQAFQLVKQGDIAYQAGDFEKAERFYGQALDLAKQAGVETNFIYSSLAETFKKTGQHGEAYQASLHALPTPAGFRNCAVVLRRQAQEAQKVKQTLVQATILSELYRLAVLAYLCYGPHDCKSGVAGPMFERAVYLSKKLKLNEIKSTFVNNGPIVEGGILSERDYKMFAKVFGPSIRTYNPFEDYAQLVWDANEYLKRHIVEIERLLPSDEKAFERKVQARIEFLKGLYPFAFN